MALARKEVRWPKAVGPTRRSTGLPASCACRYRPPSAPAAGYFYVGGLSVATLDEFSGFNWHDNAIHGIRIVEGEDGCSGDLVLDIDFIVEWLQPEGGAKSFRFRVAPTDLTFHQTTDLVICIDYASCSGAFQPMTIHQIHRESITYPSGHPAFAWKIELNWPSNGFISFHSPGFTQTVRTSPVETDAQCLSLAQRNS